MYKDPVEERLDSIERALQRLGLWECEKCGEWVVMKIHHKAGGIKRGVCPECYEVA